MTRVVLSILALMAVPFIIYGMYELLRRGPDGKGARKPSEWERESVTRLGFAGLVMGVLGVVAILVTSEGNHGGKYVPARVENGKLIPGGFIDTDKSPERGKTQE